MEDSHSGSARGFTLLETLTVVALLVVLFSVGFPSLVRVSADLRGAELDTDAQQLCAAAQNRMELLASASRLDELAAASAPDIPAAGANALFSGDPSVTVTPAQAARIKNGAGVRSRSFPSGRVRVYTESGEFLALGQATDGLLTTIKGFFEVN